MYGKYFASTFSGSLFGAGSDVFAVWGYVIANAVDGQVELNPRLLASVIGTDSGAVERSIEFLCSPDPTSRSPEEDGRRLVREGQFAYRVTNHRHYRSILNEAERRDYNRQKKRESRARSKTESMTVVDMSAVSAHTESKTEAEEKNERTTPTASGVVDLVAFYNALTGRRLTPSAQEKAIRPSLKAGVPLPTLKLALIGACLNPFHLGSNDRKTTYLDPETILKQGRLDGHAILARGATWNVDGGDVVWPYWTKALRIGRSQAMVRFLKTRDSVLVEEGSEPMGPQRAVGMDEWPE